MGRRGRLQRLRIIALEWPDVELQTTLGYMHLAKGETERAIRLLDEPFISPAMHANSNLTATEPYADQSTAA